MDHSFAASMAEADEKALTDAYVETRRTLMNATDELLLSKYLKNMVDDVKYLPDHIALNVDVYKEDPRDECDLMNPTFSSFKYRTKACGRADGCGTGCWRIIAKDKLLKYEVTGKFLGFKRILKFCGMTIPREYKRFWVMEEYRLMGKRNSKKDHVICKIRLLFQTEVNSLLAKHFAYSSKTPATRSLPVYGESLLDGGPYYLQTILDSVGNEWPKDVTNDDVYSLHPLALVDLKDQDFIRNGLCIFANRTDACGFTDGSSIGYWRIIEPDMPIKSLRMMSPGFKRVFRFYEREDRDNFVYTENREVGTWIMEEYRLANEEVMKDKVLCVIKLRR